MYIILWLCVRYREKLAFWNNPRVLLASKGRFMFTAHCFRRTTRDCFYANTSKCYNLRGVSYDAKVTWVKIVDHYRRLQVSFQGNLFAIAKWRLRSNLTFQNGVHEQASLLRMYIYIYIENSFYFLHICCIIL